MIYIAFLIFTLLILLIALYQWQYFMIFSPTHFREEDWHEHTQILSVISDDGKELEGVIYSPTDAKNTVLFFAGRSHDSVGLINRLARTYPKTQIITFNYRSYGKSQGKVSEKNTLKDGLKIAELVQKNYGDFYLFGFSLGSSIAAYIASKHHTKGLILVGAFDSIYSLARVKYRSLKFFSRYKFNTAAFVTQVEAPTYLFASRDDKTTPIKNALLLKDKIKNLEYFSELSHLTHKEILWDSRVTSKIKEIVE